jgi:hypothetical protein
VSLAIAALLAFAVLAAWLAAAALLRLPVAFDRLHLLAFANAALGLPLLAAALVADGASIRTGKIALIVALQLGGGAALTHATARLMERRP